MSIPPALTLRTVANALPRPQWWIDFLTTEPLAFASLDRWSGTVAELLDTMFDPTVTFDDLAWIKSQWPGKFVVKGVQTVADARAVTDLGVDGDRAVQSRWAATRSGARSRSTCCPTVVARGRQRRRGPPRHRHHVRRRHRGRHRHGRPVHADRPRLPVRADGRRRGRRRPCHRDPRPARSSARCGCSASRASRSSTPATSRSWCGWRRGR